MQNQDVQGWAAQAGDSTAPGQAAPWDTRPRSASADGTDIAQLCAAPKPARCGHESHKLLVQHFCTS